MNHWQQVVGQLDQALGIPDRASSRLRKLSRVFDSKANEHVILLEYRAQASSAAQGEGEGNPPRSNVEDRMLSGLDW